MFRKCSEFGAHNNSETMLMPTEWSTTNKLHRTNKTVQGNLLHDYEQKFANLPYYLQWINCAPMQVSRRLTAFHRPLDDAEFDKLGGSCREYTHFETTHYIIQSERIPIQKNGQSGGTKSPKRGPFPSWMTDRLPDLRVLPGHWSQ